MDLFTSLCRQWAEQYTELEQQRNIINQTMATLAGLIETYGGKPAIEQIADSQELHEEIVNNTPATEVPAVHDLQKGASNYYDDRGTWAYKIEYVLAPVSEDDPPLSVLEISNSIQALEPGMEINRIVKAVTMEASKMGLNGKLGIKKKGNKNFYFVPRQLGLGLGE